MKAEDGQRLIALAGRRVTRVTGVTGVTPSAAMASASDVEGVTDPLPVTPASSVKHDQPPEESERRVTPVTPVTRVTKAVGTSTQLAPGRRNECSSDPRTDWIVVAASAQSQQPKGHETSTDDEASTPRLTARPAEWDRSDWQAFFEERAATREIDGGMFRAEAEALAFDDAVQQWLALHPPSATEPRHGCAACGEHGGPRGELIAVLAEAGHAWVHDACWAGWREGRREQAREALRAMGIGPPGPPRGPD